MISTEGRALMFCDESAEKQVLACLLSPYGLQILPDVRDDLFSGESNLVILGAVRQLLAKAAPVDVITVSQLLEKSGQIEKAGGRGRITELADPCSPSAALYHLNILRELAKKRLAFRVFREGQKQIEGGSDVSSIIGETRVSLDSLLSAYGSAIEARALSTLQSEDKPGAELIRHRFLCRGGGALLVGPSGIGKSTLTMQLALAWAVATPVFGMCPARPLRSLIIQAENDEDDMREMRDGCLNGLDLRGPDRTTAAQEVLTYTADSHTGSAFLAEVLEPLVKNHKPDIVWIDPAFSFLGGDSNSAQEVGGFLRNGLNPILHRHECAAVIVHHTNKPSRGKEKGDYQAGDFAYLGAGSAEWTNWARAVLAIQSLGSHEVFKFHAAKRGARLHWKDDMGEWTREKHIAHARERGFQHWREADPEDIPSEGGRPQKYTGDEVIQAMNGREWSYTELCAELSGTISKATVERRLKKLKAEGKVMQTENGKWKAI